MNPVQLIIGIAVVAVAAVFLIVFLSHFRLWLQSYMAGGNISFADLVGMTFRKVNPKEIVQAKTMAVQAGLQVDTPGSETAISTHNLQCHYLAGGDVAKVVSGLIAAKRAHVDLSYPEACVIDLSGRDVAEEVSRRGGSGL